VTAGARRAATTRLRSIAVIDSWDDEVFRAGGPGEADRMLVRLSEVRTRISHTPGTSRSSAVPRDSKLSPEPLHPETENLFDAELRSTFSSQAARSPAPGRTPTAPAT
jgi:hypothetical protein